MHTSSNVARLSLIKIFCRLSEFSLEIDMILCEIIFHNLIDKDKDKVLFIERENLVDFLFETYDSFKI